MISISPALSYRPLFGAKPERTLTAEERERILARAKQHDEAIWLYFRALMWDREYPNDYDLLGRYLRFPPTEFSQKPLLDEHIIKLDGLLDRLTADGSKELFWATQRIAEWQLNQARLLGGMHSPPPEWPELA